jgi:1-acyl-sn-glycerol-3-phosphate acyltransferase
MEQLQYQNYHYQSPSKKIGWFSRLFPTFNFYIRLIWIVYHGSRIAKAGRFDGAAWVDHSLGVLRALENVGVHVDISGLEHLHDVKGPVVIVGNHMSMMETVLLPSIIRPLRRVTYVIKESLLHYPVFKYVMRSREPIAISRTNPRLDLKLVLDGGVERVKQDISIIVFPQTTRATEFDPKQMSSIGVKLAKKAGVPVIPLALKTDCWQNGSWLKDFGRIQSGKTAYFAFGKPLYVAGKGDEEQAAVSAFISGKLQSWQKEK